MCGRLRGFLHLMNLGVGGCGKARTNYVNRGVSHWEVE